MTPLTPLEQSLGVEYVDEAYEPGERLRYGKNWDEKAWAMALRVLVLKRLREPLILGPPSGGDDTSLVQLGSDMTSLKHEAAEEIVRLQAELNQRNIEFREYARETELEFRKRRP